MSDKKTLTFYLQPEFRERAQNGQVNFVNKIVSAVGSCGFKSEFCGNSDLEMAQSAAKPGLSMFHMEDPFHDRALTMRLAYFYPFWRIERFSKRWEWQVARAKFNPLRIDPDQANRFVSQWKKRLFSSDIQTVKAEPGFVYMPLQGRLSEHRSFQSMSPIDMIKATLDHERNRKIYANLHPKEKYSDAELSALNELENKHSRFSVVPGKTEGLVRGCDYIVTQNSGIVLQGYFHQKPAILFGKIDFHHIGLNVEKIDIKDAFANVVDHKPDYARYLFWFLQKKSINAGRENAENQILRTVRSHGWQI